MMRGRRNKAEEDRQVYKEGYRELQEEYGNDPAVTLDLHCDQALEDASSSIVMVRGKQITHEQSVQVLAAMEPLFREWDKNHLTARGKHFFDERRTSGTLGTCLFRQGDAELSSWLLSDGTIGGNISDDGMYTMLWHILPQWVELAKACPFLDMAVGYTTASRGESICTRCMYSRVDDQTGDYYDNGRIDLHPGPADELHVEPLCVEECKRRKELFKTYAGAIRPEEYEFCYADRFDRRMHHRDMHKLVRGCFIIKNGHISVYWGGAGCDRFQEYYDKYHDPYLDGLYGRQILYTDRRHIWSRSDVIDAFALKGLPAECYDIAVYHRFIREIPADAPILTAEWLRKEHREMCKKWNIPIE